MKTLFQLIIFLLLILIFVLTSEAKETSRVKSKLIKTGNQNNKGYIPSKGFVPDNKTAIKIAEAIWLPIYGKDNYHEKPFKATLIDGKIWHVSGSLPIMSLGGVAEIDIQKSDCKILSVWHGK